MTKDERITALYATTTGLMGGTRVAAALFVEELRKLPDSEIDGKIAEQRSSAVGPFGDWLAILPA